MGAVGVVPLRRKIEQRAGPLADFVGGVGGQVADGFVEAGGVLEAGIFVGEELVVVGFVSEVGVLIDFAPEFALRCR